MKNYFKQKVFVFLNVFIFIYSVHSFASEEIKCNTIKQLLLSRYSGYDYDASKDVTHAQVRTILEAGRLAPSSYNEQPWRFIVCKRTANSPAYDIALSCLQGGNEDWAKNAPVLIVCVAALKSERNGKLNGWAQYDTGAASFAMMLQATSLGLMAHQMGGFDQAKLMDAFAIPEGFAPMSVMAIGYAEEVKTTPIKKRKPLGENFFMGEWALSFE